MQEKMKMMMILMFAMIQNEIIIKEKLYENFIKKFRKKILQRN